MQEQLHKEQLVRHLGTDEGEPLQGGCAVVVGRVSRGWRWLQCWDTASARFVDEGATGVPSAKLC